MWSINIIQITQWLDSGLWRRPKGTRSDSSRITWILSFRSQTRIFPLVVQFCFSFSWRQSSRHAYSNLSRYFVRSVLRDIGLVCGFFLSLEMFLKDKTSVQRSWVWQLSVSGLCNESFQLQTWHNSLEGRCFFGGWCHTAKWNTSLTALFPIFNITEFRGLKNANKKNQNFVKC